MNLTEIALRRPAFITMVIMGLVVIGLYSYSKLGVDLYPNVNFPVVTVTTVYPGANPQEIETTISKPIEEAVGTIPGLDEIQTISSEGVSLAVIKFKLEASLDTVAIDVQKKIDAIINKFPKDVEKPVISKADINAMPIMTLSVLGAKTPPEKLYFLVKDKIKPQLERVSGVATIQMVGEVEREIQIQLKSREMQAHSLSISQLSNMLKLDNLNVPGGSIDRSKARIDIRVLGEFQDLEQIKAWPIKLPNGSVIPLSTIAYVKDTHKKQTSISRTNGKPSLGLIISKQSDASVVKVAHELKKAFKKISGLPEDVKIQINTDTSVYIEKSLEGVKENLLEGILFTAIILLIFLGSVPSTIIVLLAIPTSLIATFIIMYASGMTLNVLTLMGLALTIGILVDDSIVALENIHRHLEMGKNPFDAALQGRTEIAMAALAITLVDVVVYLPIAFMGGIIGQFFKPFALTIVTAAIFSLFMSFTLTPMLSYFFLRVEKKQSFFLVQWIIDLWEHIFNGLRFFYEHFIRWALKNKMTIILFCIAAMVYSCSLVPSGKIGSEFIPQADQGEFTVSVTLPINTPLKKTNEISLQIEREISKIPEMTSFFATVGLAQSQGMLSMGGSGSPHLLTVYVRLKELANRKRGVQEIMASLRPKFKNIAGAEVIISASASGGPGGAPVEVQILGKDMEAGKKIAEQVFQIVKSTQGTVDVRNSWIEGKQEYTLKIDRRKAADFGLSVVQVAGMIRSSLEGEVVSRYREEGREADIRLILGESDRQQIKDITRLPILTPSGKQIFLSQIAEFNRNAGPTQISRKDRERRISISANVLGRSSGAIMQEVLAKANQLKLPEGIRIASGSNFESQADSFKELLTSLMLSIVLVYMLMVALYESYLYPFTIMFALPLALVGALNALALSGKTINIFTLLGIIMLMGLVAKNGILLIDFTNRLREDEGLEVKAALIKAGSLRLRPILMTTIAMIFGMLPLALSTGSGSETRSGLATVIIGGLISSLVLTLVLLPVVYLLADSFVNRFSRKRKGRHA